MKISLSTLIKKNYHKNYREESIGHDLSRRYRNRRRAVRRTKQTGSRNDRDTRHEIRAGREPQIAPAAVSSPVSRYTGRVACALSSHCTPCTCRTVHATTWPPVIRVPSFLPSTLTGVPVCPQLHYTRALCNAERAHAPSFPLSQPLTASLFSSSSGMHVAFSSR